MNEKIFISGLSDSQIVKRIRKAKNVAQIHKVLLSVLEPKAIEFNFPDNRKFGASIANGVYACFYDENKQSSMKLTYYKTEKEALRVATEIASIIRQNCKIYNEAEIQLRHRLNTLNERKSMLLSQIADAEKTLDDVTHANAYAQLGRIDEEIELIVNSL